MPFFERYRSFFRWNDISYETTEKTVSIRAKKQKSQKMKFDHYAPGPFNCFWGNRVAYIATPDPLG